MLSNPLAWLLLCTSLAYDASYTWLGNTKNLTLKKKIIRPLWLYGWIPNLILTAALITLMSDLPIETTKESILSFALAPSTSYGWICWLILKSDFKRPH